MRVVESECLIRFLEFVGRQEGWAIMHEWVAFALDYRRADECLMLLGEVESQTDLEDWWKRNRGSLEAARLSPPASR